MTSFRLANAPSKVSGCLSNTLDNKYFKPNHLGFPIVQNLHTHMDNQVCLSMLYSCYSIPPQSNTSPDLTSLTASSADSHTFRLFGTGKSTSALSFLMTVTRAEIRTKGTGASLVLETCAINMVVEAKSDSKLPGLKEACLTSRLQVLVRESHKGLAIGTGSIYERVTCRTPGRDPYTAAGRSGRQDKKRPTKDSARRLGIANFYLLSSFAQLFFEPHKGGKETAANLLLDQLIDLARN